MNNSNTNLDFESHVISMNSNRILFDEESKAIPPEDIGKLIVKFGDKYNNATQAIIKKSNDLDNDGDVFVECAARILSSFGMTRSGPFQGLKISKNGKVNDKKLLLQCWNKIGEDLVRINNSIRKSSVSRDRYLLEIGGPEREKLITQIWEINKKLLPITMGNTSYGLVGASKILFSVLPEIVLPIDNSQWLHVFKTVDLGDVIRHMTIEIQRWEADTGKKLNELDQEKRLSTLPSVYNVMAMTARP